jgi:DNA-binding LytR/AlgR family response regulator
LLGKFKKKQDDKMIKLLWADIYHLESIKNYVKIKTAQYQSGLLIRSSLQNLIDEMLPLAIKNRFIKINRSEAIEKSIVNMIGNGYVSTTFGEFRTSIDLKRDDFL